MPTLEELVQLYSLLAGVAALIAVLVDVLKRFGVIKDDQAPAAVLLLNVVGFVLFVVANVLGLPIAGIDVLLGSVAALLAALLGIIGQVAVSRGVHFVLRDTPIIGYSHSRRFRS